MLQSYVDLLERKRVSFEPRGIEPDDLCPSLQRVRSFTIVPCSSI